MSVPENPSSRVEMFLNAIRTGDGTNLPHPSTRIEEYLYAIYQNGGAPPEQIAAAVADWLDEHVDPETGYVLDNTLTIEGAAADAKSAGDKIGELKSAIGKEYSPNETYLVGEYRWHDGKFYVCAVAIETPEAWTAEHWRETTVADELEALKSVYEPTSWADIQALVRTGMIGRYIEPGDQLSVSASGTLWDTDVQGIDEDCPVDPNRTHVLSIQFHKVFRRLNFDPPQYLVAVTAAALTAWGISGSVLPAGTYNVTLDHGAYNGGTAEDGTFQFTTTQPIPIGGGIRHSYMGTYQESSGDYAKAKVLAGTFVTYDADTKTTIETGLVTTEGNDGISLGTTTVSTPSYKVGDYINFTQRQRYGSNRWSTSFMRQYLNSDEATVTFKPGTIWSRNNADAIEGFLHTLDPELKAVLGKVRKRYALCVADGYGYEDCEDLVTLDTFLDMGGGKNNNISEGPVDAEGNVTRTTAYSFWKDKTTNAERIKYQGSSAANWWLGSCLPSYANRERYVYPSGTFYSDFAHFSYGVVPSLYII